MAIINGMYIHVTGESVTREVDATSHPVENGIPTTDTVRPQALAISIRGSIVDYGNMQAAQVISKLKALQDSGSLITYSGRNVASSMQIRSFDSEHVNTINGGAQFTMELVKVRIAKSAYTPKKASTKAQQTAAKKELSPDDITVGATVVFKGGSVYNSSDAKKVAATRSRSTCKVTIINKRSWAVHQYHLISTDGKKVYGWVDFANIEGVEATGTSGTTNAGTQQIKNGNKNGVYHTVKPGDTVYKLVNSKYRSYGVSTNTVIDNNPDAFAVKGNAATLKVGTKLLIGYK